MAGRKNVLEEALTTLLRWSARMVRDDRRYRTPSLDREEPVDVVTLAHRLGLLKARDTAARIDELKAELTQNVQAAIEKMSSADESIPPSHPLLFLREAVLLQIAVDEAIAALMIERASLSKGFHAHLEARHPLASKAAIDLLADALARKSVRAALTTEAGLQDKTIDHIVSVLMLEKTRRLVQLHGSGRDVHAVTKNVEPVKKRRGRPPKARNGKERTNKRVAIPEAELASGFRPDPSETDAAPTTRETVRLIDDGDASRNDLEHLFADFDS